MDKTLYNLKLHEEICAESGYHVFRVPGGWIYRFWDYSNEDYFSHATFVPFNNEFENVEDKK